VFWGEEKIMEVSTVLVVDLRSRKIDAFTASVTQLPSGRLVLRKATDLGCLADLPDGPVGLDVMTLGGYSAQSSGGFSEVIAPEYYAGGYELAGGCGFGYGAPDPVTGKKKGDALRPMTNKRGAGHPLIFVPEPTLRKVGGAKNSNPATATAGVAGLQLLARMRGEVVVAEGQSDWARAWALRPKPGAEHPIFPAEHRPEIFGEAQASPNENSSFSAPADIDEFVEVDETPA